MSANRPWDLLQKAYDALVDDLCRDCTRQHSTLRQEIGDALKEHAASQPRWALIGNTYVRNYHGHFLEVTPTAARSVFLWRAIPHAEEERRGSASTLQEAKDAATAFARDGE